MAIVAPNAQSLRALTHAEAPRWTIAPHAWVRKVAVIPVHGIGSDSDGFSAKLSDNIAQYLGGNEVNTNIYVRPFYWQNMIEPFERKLVVEFGPAKWKFLRRFLCTYVGDAVCYQPRHGLDTFYSRINAGLDDHISNIHKQLGPDTAIIPVGYSLGSVVVANYLYDLATASTIGAASLSYEPNAPQSTLDSVKSIFTMGSPVSLWALRYSPEIWSYPISPDVTWTNIWSPNDVISGPLGLVGGDWAKYVKDVELHVGGLATRWNPLAHLKYLGDKTVARLIADDAVKLRIGSKSV